MRSVSYTHLDVYKRQALSKGIIIADTKFEFGLDEEGNLVIGDEMLTPDSSRFWPADGYEPGHGQPSFDKQFARDWLKANPDNNWTLPQEIVDVYKRQVPVLSKTMVSASAMASRYLPPLTVTS